MNRRKANMSDTENLIMTSDHLVYYEIQNRRHGDNTAVLAYIMSDDFETHINSYPRVKRI